MIFSSLTKISSERKRRKEKGAMHIYRKKLYLLQLYIYIFRGREIVTLCEKNIDLSCDSRKNETIQRLKYNYKI